MEAQAKELEARRLEVESSRKAGEAETAQRVEVLKAEEFVLQRKRDELEVERSRLEGAAEAEAKKNREAEEVLQDRIQRLANAELRLESEKRELARSRAALAMVQAHVVSMLDDKKRKPGNVSFHQLHGEDADAEEAGPQKCYSSKSFGDGADDKNSFDRVWSMDWTADVLGACEAAGAAAPERQQAV